ncbi:tigger transposable element-derived protein 1 [Trichonephila clavipes]|nr:tigger transposable element-derived protein 1 [Trichonephila clavipes]
MEEKKKHQRQSISLETKIAILDRLGKGEGSTAIGKHFNLGEFTVRAIKKNEAAIRKSVISGTKLSTKFASYTRDVLIERTERAIAIWIEEQVQRKIPKVSDKVPYKFVTDVAPPICQFLNNQSENLLSHQELATLTSPSKNFIRFGMEDGVPNDVQGKTSHIRWLSRIFRYNDLFLTKKKTFSRIGRKGKKGKPPIKSLDNVENDLKLIGVGRWSALEPDGAKWRRLCETVLT